MTCPEGVCESGEAGDTVVLYLDKTPFYAEGGGQVSDKGILSTKEGRGEVLSVEKQSGVYRHKVKITEGVLRVGDVAAAMIDKSKRNCTARNHTATHLLQKALQDVVGSHIEQAGSYVSETMLRFDFSHFEALTKEQISQVEALVNEKINLFLDVTVSEMSLQEAQKAGAMALFEEKYGEKVRVVNVGDWSIELCGGTHVRNSGQIGAFKILSESGVASGIRRIEAITGTGVLERAKEYENLLESAAETLKTTKAMVVERVRTVSSELKAAKKELEELKKAAMGGEADALMAQAVEKNGVKLVCKELKDYTIQDLRSLSDDIKAKYKGVILILATVNGPKVTFLVSVTDDLLEKGYHAGNLIKPIAAACGGGGGGKADMAQAGAKDPTKIAEAFALAETLI